MNVKGAKKATLRKRLHRDSNPAARFSLVVTFKSLPIYSNVVVRTSNGLHTAVEFLSLTGSEQEKKAHMWRWRHAREMRRARQKSENLGRMFGRLKGAHVNRTHARESSEMVGRKRARSKGAQASRTRARENRANVGRTRAREHSEQVGRTRAQSKAHRLRRRRARENCAHRWARTRARENANR